jgi:hypothetical protein
MVGLMWRGSSPLHCDEISELSPKGFEQLAIDVLGRESVNAQGVAGPHGNGGILRFVGAENKGELIVIVGRDSVLNGIISAMRGLVDVVDVRTLNNHSIASLVVV